MKTKLESAEYLLKGQMMRHAYNHSDCAIYCWDSVYHSITEPIARILVPFNPYAESDAVDEFTFDDL